MKNAFLRLDVMSYKNTLPISLSILSVFVGVFMLYWLTLAPNIIWGDSAKLTIYAYQKLIRWDDIVGGHPLHSILSSILASFMYGENYAYKINLFSASFGALSVLMVMLIVCRMTNSIFSSVMSGIMLSISHTFWSYSVVAESYSLIVFVSMFVLYLMVLAKHHSYKNFLLFISGLISALSLSANALLIISVPGLFYISLVIGGRRGLLMYLVGLILGILVLALLVSMFSDLNTNLSSGKQAAFAYIDLAKFPTELIKILIYLLYQFPSVFFLYIAYSIKYSLSHRDSIEFGILLAALSIISFSLIYLYQRQFVLLILAYAYLAILGGVAVSKIKIITSNRLITLSASVIMTILLYSVSPTVVNNSGLSIINYRPAPGRDLSYFLSPWKQGHNMPYMWGYSMINSLEENSVIYADFTLGSVIKYMIIVEELRKDITVVEIDKWIYSKNGAYEYLKAIRGSLSDGLPVYLAQDYDPYYKTTFLSNHFDINKGQYAYRVIDKKGI